MHRITSEGFRVHDSVRGPDGQAKRVLVLGHTTLDNQAGFADDYAHLNMAEVKELHGFLGEFLEQFKGDEGKKFPIATKTAGDLAIYAKWDKKR